jgi:streptogramin lyase
MSKAAYKIFWLFLALMIATAQLAAADIVLHGVVTNDAGKPVRGAIIKATSGIKSVSRFSQSDGRYEIPLPSGTYDVSVDAFGFAGKRQSVDTVKTSEMSFRLSSRMDVGRLTPAELESLLPDNSQTRLIRRTCEDCHALGTVMRRRGNTAADWQDFLPTMTKGRLPQPHFSPARLAALGEALEKYFGPSAPFLGPDSDPPKPEQVKHAITSDLALKATITEYRVPTPGAMPNSVMIDAKDRPWWGEFDSSNEIGEMDPVTEQIHLYPMETPMSTPHTGTLGKDGSIWMSLHGDHADHVADKLARVNPDTGKVTYYKSQDPGLDDGTHTLAVDPQGNVWSSGNEPAVFDIEKEQFRVYRLPVPKTYPEESVGAWLSVPGEPVSPNAETYDVAVDSKGTVWLTSLNQGKIIRLDPASGETKDYKTPGIVSARGLVVDAEDNIWFGNFFGHTLAKLDPKTGTVKQYHPPTANATPYGAVVDKKSGYIYYADTVGNHVTGFDPKTEQFVEYPLPSYESYPRFLGLDTKGRVWYGEGGPFQTKIGMLDPGVRR